jgi:hypothetical protein
MAERVEIDIIANVTKAISGLEKLVKQLAATYLGYRALKDFLVSSIKEALEAERAYVALGSAMRASGQNAEVYTKQLQGLARALSMTTTFAEEETMAAMQSLTQIGRVSAEGMKKIIPVVQDLSAGLGIDLNSAALLVGKAIEGNVGALSRYGVKIKETKDPVERFSSIIEGLTGRFGGMSEAMAKSAGGGLKQIKNEFNELKEAVGTRLIQAFAGTITWLSSRMQTNVILGMKAGDIGTIEEGSAYLKTLRREMESDQKWIKDLEAKWGFKIDPTKKYSSRSGGDALGDTFKRIAELQNKIDAINRQMAKLGQTAGTGGGPLLPGISGESIDKVNAATKALSDHLQALQDAKLEIWTHAWAQSSMDLADAEQEAARQTQAMMDAVDPEGLKAVNDQLHKMAVEFGTIAETLSSENKFPLYGGAMKDFAGDAEKAAEATKKLTEQHQNLAIQIGQDAFVSFFDAIGKAAAGTESFAEAMKNLIAQVAASIGKLMVQAGLEIIIANAYNPAMIALGIALMVAGGVTIAAGSYVGAQDTGNSGNVPAMARGGIVTRPTLALVGESGPEAIVPLGRGGGGNTIIVQGSIWAARDLARELAAIQGRW